MGKVKIIISFSGNFSTRFWKNVEASFVHHNEWTYYKTLLKTLNFHHHTVCFSNSAFRIADDRLLGGHQDVLTTGGSSGNTLRSLK